MDKQMNKIVTVKIIFMILILFCINMGQTEAQNLLKVKAKAKPDSEWKDYETRTTDNIAGLLKTTKPTEDEFGGRMDKAAEATGYFYSKKINDRWWIIDPDGNKYIAKGVVTVKPGTSEKQIELVKKKFGTVQNWLDETSNLLSNYGFNGTGNWSDADLLIQSKIPLTYTRSINFMSSYGKIRGGTFQQPGHTGYPDDLIFVFDPNFESFCDKESEKASQYKNEKRLLGYFSDNELPFPDNALDRYLKLDKKDYGYQAAEKWLIENKGNSANQNELTNDDREKFLEYMSSRYFELVSKALKKYDPNHMYLGCRFYGHSLKEKSLFESAGKYLDIISVNYYNVWTPKAETMDNWSKWSGRPVIITEWYAKGEDSGMANETGAGWIVHTQKDRGLFYQNFALALLQSKVCVGWHWFKYQDNDPDDNREASNLNSNKGIINNNFEPYTELMEEMKKVNIQVYSIIDCFDKQ